MQIAEAKPGPWKTIPLIDGPFVDGDAKPYYWTPDHLHWPDDIEVRDEPNQHRSRGNLNGSMTFETCALCIRSGEVDAVLGCVTWGYKFTKDDPSKDELIPMDTSVQPSDKFLKTVWKEYSKHDLKPCDPIPSSYAPPLE
ncbi:hypothetical protein [Stieleria varia]|nr:hypothetical protein [Stieleria varia]